MIAGSEYMRTFVYFGQCQVYIDSANRDSFQDDVFAELGVAFLKTSASKNASAVIAQ